MARPKDTSPYPHGENRGWWRGCRCVECVTAIRAHWKKKRDEIREKPIPDHVHGTVNGYNNFMCRCELCLAAWQTTYDRNKAWREANHDTITEARYRYYHEVEKPRRQAEEESRRKKRNGRK